MKIADQIKIIRNIPVYRAVFRVKKVPVWAADFVAVGDEVVADETNTMITAAGKRIDLGASFIEFVEYREYPRGLTLIQFNV
jgi:hypothetical protein